MAAKGCGLDEIGNVPRLGTEECLSRHLVIKMDHWCAWPGRKALCGHVVQGWRNKGLIGRSIELVREAIEAAALIVGCIEWTVRLGRPARAGEWRA